MDEDSWRKKEDSCACWCEQKEESFWLGIQIGVVAHITLHLLVHILKHEMYFSEKYGVEKNWKEEKVSHACIEVSHLCISESPSID